MRCHTRGKKTMEGRMAKATLTSTRTLPRQRSNSTARRYMPSGSCCCRPSCRESRRGEGPAGTASAAGPAAGSPGCSPAGHSPVGSRPGGDHSSVAPSGRSVSDGMLPETAQAHEENDGQREERLDRRSSGRDGLRAEEPGDGRSPAAGPGCNTRCWPWRT